eukprot:11793492-Alexandrium_andersonii.AAC.1
MDLLQAAIAYEACSTLVQSVVIAARAMLPAVATPCRHALPTARGLAPGPRPSGGICCSAA